MRVTRTQWPVGQGCFASGIIDAAGVAPIHYVYDCGARNVSHLGIAVKRYADAVPEIDALFISHFDGDHVDGLDILLTTVKAKTVYLPYLEDDERVAALLEADALGELTTSLIQAQLDPAGWFGGRGVDRVIFVRNGGEAPGDGFVPPPAPEGPAAPDDRREKTCLKEPPSSLLAAGGPMSAALSQMLVGGYIPAVQAGVLRWIFVPFVPAIDPQRQANFRNRVRGVLGLADGADITPDVFQAKLKNGHDRTAVRACYDEILADGGGRNHNKVSMSIYSGPPDRVAGVVHWSRHWDRERGWYRRYWDNAAEGWIGTGDAKLKDGERRHEWTSFYRRIAPFIGTMLLPHHGSKANWHRDLLDNKAIKLFVAAADRSNKGYKHPSASVVLDIADANRSLAHVTKHPQTQLVEWISIGPARS